MKHSIDRRSKIERRKIKQSPEFPIQDSNGEMILQERRCIPERRVEGTDTTLSYISQDEFKEYLKEVKK